MNHLDYCSANFLHVVNFFLLSFHDLESLSFPYLSGHATSKRSCWPLISLFSQVRDMEERDELVACPGTILRAIARILIDRCKL